MKPTSITTAPKAWLGPLTLLPLLLCSASAQEQQDPKEPEELPPILVTGHNNQGGVPKVPLDAVGSRDVFGPEQIRETGARDVNDLLQHLPAISTRPYNGGEAAAPSFSTRGLPDDGLTEYIHVLIDGVPASPMPYGWTAFSFFPLPPERIYAIDYLRGAHSVRYSPNSVGGVLNFITLPLPEQAEMGFKTTVGDYGYSSNMVTGGSSAGPWSWRLTYVDREGEGYRKGGEFAQEDFSFKLRRELDNDGSWWAGSAGYMSSDHKAPGGLTLDQFAADRFGNSRPDNAFTGSRQVSDFVYHAQVDQKTWVETFAYQSVTKRNLKSQSPSFPAPGDPLTLSDWNDTSNVAAVGMRFEQKLGGSMNHKLYGGARYEREWIPSWTIDSSPLSGGPATEELDESYLINAYSMHLDDTFNPADDWTVTVGGRFEYVPNAKGKNKTPGGIYHFDESFSAFLPGVGINWMPHDDWSLFANWFEGFRAPQAWGYGLVPDPSSSNLKFERSRSFELGTRYRPDDELSASATLWRNEYDDFGVFYTGFYENLGQISAQGIDFEGSWGPTDGALEGLLLSGSLTLQNTEIESGPSAGNDMPYAWNDKAAWHARYLLDDSWSLAIGGTYMGSSFSDEENTIAENANGDLGLNPARVLWDAQISGAWDVARSGILRVGVGATNLFDNDWFVHSRGGFFGGGKVAGAPLQTFASVSLTINI